MVLNLSGAKRDNYWRKTAVDMQGEVVFIMELMDIMQGEVVFSMELIDM